MCSLNLALLGHRETVHIGICEGGNSLGIVALVAEYGKVLSKILTSVQLNHLSHTIQKELITLIAKAVRHSLLSKINKSAFWSIILDNK